MASRRSVCSKLFMSYFKRLTLLLFLLTALAGSKLFGASGPVDASSVIPFLSEWTLVDHVPLRFDAHHTQGMVKIGPNFYLSAVEVLEKTASTKAWKSGYSRTVGKGIGHLFEFDLQGQLLREIHLGGDTLYHPGGMDFDGQWIWVPVAEYRPRSFTIIYKVDPVTLKTVEAFRVKDHIGALVFNRELKTLVGMSWGAEFFYEWTPDGHLLRKAKNEFSDVQYQDCKYVQGPAMLCSGVLGNAMGRLDLIDLLDFSLVTGMWAIPRTQKGTLLTRNPMAIDVSGDGLLYYFLPEDRFGTLYVYELR